MTRFTESAAISFSAAQMQVDLSDRVIERRGSAMRVGLFVKPVEWRARDL